MDFKKENLKNSQNPPIYIKYTIPLCEKGSIKLHREQNSNERQLYINIYFMVNMMLCDFRKKGSGRELTLANDELSSSPEATQSAPEPRIWIWGVCFLCYSASS